MPNLVIVESPAKAKTIGKYLGNKYTVKASMGHLRDLPKSKMGVDIEGDFEPQYIPISGKAKLINELKKAAAESDKVFLATDPDREGEAISWHLAELLKLPKDKVCRVTFNEITKNVVTQSISTPRDIDIPLVDAQQARRVLDRIVGYKLSPLLWKKIKRGLSAGRVQSVCTRLVFDREEEINAFVPQEYWSIEAQLGRIAPNTGSFTAAFYGTVDKKMELNSEAETMEVVNTVEKSDFLVKSITRGERQKNPAPPFITSTFQQDASRKFGMTSKKAMMIAQTLYEGVDIAGHGTTGLITYMRTDSLRLSEEAIGECRTFIQGRYGQAYATDTARRFKTKGGAQDAHEAIRPTYVNLTPEDIKKDLTPDQYKVYKLIWSRFVACQMSNAVYATVSVDITADKYMFRATSSSLKFAGFTAVYEEGKDTATVEEPSLLPDLKEAEKLNLDQLDKKQHFTQPPARYTEATLIKAMEEKGIGRPSTYAPTISTIIDREYVQKEGRNLGITTLGQVVTQLMLDKFGNIVDVTFTARMEQELDDVEKGDKPWKSSIREFYTGFNQSLVKAEEDLKETRIELPVEESEEVCELCGKNLVVKSGRFGKFLACPGYPDCKNTKPISEKTPGECLKCGGKILKKKSKNNNAYYGCENFPGCDFMTWEAPVDERCPECNKTMYKKGAKSDAFCLNDQCSKYAPPVRRTKTAKTEEKPEKTAKKPAAKKTTKKPAAKKTAKKKTT